MPLFRVECVHPQDGQSAVYAVEAADASAARASFDRRGLVTGQVWEVVHDNTPALRDQARRHARVLAQRRRFGFDSVMIFAFVFMLAVLGLTAWALLFDTTVENTQGRRYHHIGLLNDRQTLVIAAAVGWVLALGAAIVGALQHRLASVLRGYGVAVVLAAVMLTVYGPQALRSLSGQVPL